MKKLLLAACALSLCACATPISLQPVTYANATKADEQGAIAAELGYKAFRIAVETGVNSGLIKGSAASKVAALDNTLYSALQTVEAAYATGNATSIDAALQNFNVLLAQGNATLGAK